MIRLTGGTSKHAAPARKDTGVAYHLAVTHDDALQGVTHVIRGNDLFEATHVQRLIQTMMGWPAPTYRHHRLLAGPDGRRYLGPEGPARDQADREIVSFDGRVLILRWIDSEGGRRAGLCGCGSPRCTAHRRHPRRPHLHQTRPLLAIGRHGLRIRAWPDVNVRRGAK